MAYHDHRRSISLTHARLIQSLPALPYEQHSVNTPGSPQLPRYRDVPDREEEAGEEDQQQQDDGDSTPLLADNTQPPGYEPMYDYLRSRQQQHQEQEQSTSILDAPPTPHPPQPTQTTQCTQPQSSSLPQYAQASSANADDEDQPFSITIDAPAVASQLLPPSYDELYAQHQLEMQRLVREFDMDGTPAERTEDVCKWVITMMMLGLTIAAVLLICNYGV